MSKILTEKAEGAHVPDCGSCGGKVTGGSCPRCGADFIGQKNLKNEP
jgi:hypothetical protein